MNKNRLGQRTSATVRPGRCLFTMEVEKMNWAEFSAYIVSQVNNQDLKFRRNLLGKEPLEIKINEVDFIKQVWIERPDCDMVIILDDLLQACLKWAKHNKADFSLAWMGTRLDFMFIDVIENGEDDVESVNTINEAV